MANGRNQRTKKSPVTVSGPWIPMPLDFLRSRACAELSPHAAKMLLDLCAGLGPNAKGNGDLSAAPAIMSPKGWPGTATRVAALQELEGAGLIAITKRGNRRDCTLYAVTLWPLQCDFSKLDYGPGAFTTSDWASVGAKQATPPTIEAPATWRQARKGEKKSSPATREPKPTMHPPRDNADSAVPRFVPATGANTPLPVLEAYPPRDTFLDSPSAGVVGGVADVAVPSANQTLSPSLTAALKRTAAGRLT